MKKIIGILVIILITLSVFGQNTLRNNVYSRTYFQYSLNYWLTVGDTEYAIAYDTTSVDDNSVERKVFLWRKIPNSVDTQHNKWRGYGWEIVSDVIRTDMVICEKLESYDIDRSVRWYSESYWENEESNDDSEDRKDFDHSSIKMVDGNIIIKMLIFFGEDISSYDSKKEKEDDLYQHRWEYYTLVPDNNGTFIVRKNDTYSSLQ